MTDGQTETPRLKSEEEFQQGLDNIRNSINWFLLSEDIKGDLERQKARHEREGIYGQAETQTV